jgi:hypothetical protein
MAASSVKLQFVLGENLASLAIAWFNSGHFSHVDSVLPDGTLTGARSDIIGGGSGVRNRPAGYETWRRRVVMYVPCTPEQYAKYWAFINAQLGKPYDMSAIVAFMLDRNFHDPDQWFCSELVTAALEAAGIIGTLFEGCNKVSPTPLALVVSSIEGVVVLDLSGAS